MPIYTPIPVNRLRDLLESASQPVSLIDVRSPVEYRMVHVPQATLHPLDDLNPKALEKQYQPTAERPLYVICKSGARAARACTQLHNAGIEHVIGVEGGTDAWVAAGYHVTRSETKAMSLERQVRIAAGFLVIVGIALGWFVSPWFFLLSGFVGGGLMFAGITDWCGMGLLIARLPWNR